MSVNGTTLQPSLTTATHSAPSVIQNQGLFHCLTTPAPDGNGRPAPARSNEKPDTVARWQTDHRRFGPWQYQSKYLVTSCQGTTGLAPATMREQMMGFSGSRTANMTHDHTEYHRSKALGNTWHIPTATWLLFLLLLNTLSQPAATIHYSPTQAHHHVQDNTSTCHSSHGRTTCSGPKPSTPVTHQGP